MPENETATSTETTAPSGDNGAPSGSEGTSPTNVTVNAPAPQTEAEAKFTQADLDKHAGRRANEAKRARDKEIADALGVPIDKAREIIAERQAAEEAAKSEADKLRDQLAAVERERDTATAAAAQERFQSRMRSRLANDGVPPKSLDRALKMVDLPVDASDDDIAAEVESLRDAVPGLFAPPAGEPARPPAPSGVTAAAVPPAGGHAPQSLLEKGAAAARARFPQNDPDRDPFQRLTGRRS
jgi:DNA-binding transcriptional MerR regulator